MARHRGNAEVRADEAATARIGYAKGADTRARVLETALCAFGAEGFDSVTTRKIADRAGVSLPALSYYFGTKEALYLACARTIVSEYQEALGAAAASARSSLHGKQDRAHSATALSELMAELARFLLSTGDAARRAPFVARELASPGPAFDILAAELWRPGIDLAANLITRASGGTLQGNEARIRATMMIASLTGLASGRDIVPSLDSSDRIDAAISALRDQAQDLCKRM
ncbi:TetR/AcrR family transcriptional regulator [Sphingopyxis sp.]|uniref:TetR/AcrR family transcriptional regulator n=1 Tax=Sphingopyxis sp. TaxID=1908224 RepID=UPI002DF7128C|nr:CerR family C-terminal domain-containing protein [Sphingopyxis sp.]